MTKAKVEVYESNISSKVIATFKTINELVKWNEKHNVYADQISINDCMLLGWDELYDFV